jgi:hypothetical protein
MSQKTGAWLLSDLSDNGKRKVKVTLEHAMKAQRRITGISLFFL